MSSKQLENRKLVLSKYLENPCASGRSIAKILNFPHSTVNNIISRYKETLSLERKPGSGGNHMPSNQELTQKIIRSIKNNPGTSDRDRAKKFNTSFSTARRIRLKAGYKSYHVIKQPNRSDKQSLVAKKRARLL